MEAGKHLKGFIQHPQIPLYLQGLDRTTLTAQELCTCRISSASRAFPDLMYLMKLVVFYQHIKEKGGRGLMDVH